MNLYENLATHVKNAIRQGVYQPGDRLPSVRRLSEQHRVSQNTAVSAYRLLESHGWLEARPQSGFFARHPESSLPPAKARDNAEGPCTVSVTEVALRLCRNALQPDLVSLGAATPHPGYLPLGDLRAAFNRCLRDSNDVASRYSFPPGEESLRIRIAQRAAERGCAFGPDDVVITDGCQEALNLALRAVARAGDIVAIESPAFFGTLQAIESLGMQALEIPSDPVAGISLDALALALERWPVKAVAVVSNFSNPTGSLMPDANKTRLVKMLAARGIPLIEDDIYGDLAHGRTRPRPAKAYDHADNVLLCASFSKTIAPGYRVGWIVPGRWHKAVEHLKYVSTMSNATLPQLAVAHYLADGRYERHLNKVRRSYADNLARMQAHIARHFPAGTRTSRPDGGFVLWVELPEHIDTLALHEQALRQGISFTPGNLFSPQGRYRNCLRLAAALPWDTRVEQALETLGQLARRARPASHTTPSPGENA